MKRRHFNRIAPAPPPARTHVVRARILTGCFLLLPLKIFRRGSLSRSDGAA
jgi:hypothetical protein